MTIEFTCPSCAKTLRVKDALAGRRGKCPSCQQALTVPAAVQSSGLDALDEEEIVPLQRTGAPVQRSAMNTQRKGKGKGTRRRPPKKSATNVPLLVGGIGGGALLLVVVAVVGVMLSSGDDAAPPAEQSPPEPTVTAPPTKSNRTAATVRSRQLTSYVPAETPLAFGVRYGDETSSAKKLASLRPFSLSLLESAGLGADQVSETVFACDAEQKHLVVGVRTKSAFVENKLRDRLGCDANGEDAGGARVYGLPRYRGWGPLGACFLDSERTLLIGRPETLRAAVATSSKRNPLLSALRNNAQGPGFWAVAEMSDVLRNVAHRLLPPSWIFQGNAKEAARAIKNFTVSVEFAEKMNVTMSVECRDDERARDVAGYINGVIDLLQKPVAIRTTNAQGGQRGTQGGGQGGQPGGPAGQGQGRGGAGGQPAGPTGQAPGGQMPDAFGADYQFRADFGSASSGPEGVQTSLNGPKATVVWEASATGGAARFAWGFVSALALAPLSTSAEGDELFPGPMRRLTSATLRLHQVNSAFPFGGHAREDSFLVQRVSWLAQVLPHLGQNELYERIDFKTDWDEGENRAVANTLVEAFLDPRADEFRWDGWPFAGMALTHFVGMAGLGADAPHLAADDPRAGIFGYERAAKLEDITDGAGQTIMLISAGQVYGPWISAGGSTVRGARKPYFAGMSGFQAPGTKPGAVAAFADGSVRFLDAQTDSRVFEALCTMHGAESVDVSSLEKSP